MKVISINVGQPIEVAWKGLLVRTSIFKKAVAGTVAISRLNLDGDAQADLTVHGGPEKAVYAYPAEHYAYWRKSLSGADLPWGSFGENLTTEGLPDETACIGDILRIGSAVLMITQPRLPCYKLNLRFNRDDMAKRFLLSRRTGFYFSVIEPGSVNAHSKLEIVSRDPGQVTVKDVVAIYLRDNRDPELVERAASVTALPESWRTELRARALSPQRHI